MSELDTPKSGFHMAGLLAGLSKQTKPSKVSDYSSGKWWITIAIFLCPKMGRGRKYVVGEQALDIGYSPRFVLGSVIIGV